MAHPAHLDDARSGANRMVRQVSWIVIKIRLSAIDCRHRNLRISVTCAGGLGG